MPPPLIELLHISKHFAGVKALDDVSLAIAPGEIRCLAGENGSGGTDHGAAGVGFLIGSRVKGTMIGAFPGLATGLDEEGNLKATSDFRAIYAALLEQWLGTDAAAVLPGIDSFARPALLT